MVAKINRILRRSHSAADADRRTSDIHGPFGHNARLPHRNAVLSVGPAQDVRTWLVRTQNTHVVVSAGLYEEIRTPQGTEAGTHVSHSTDACHGSQVGVTFRGSDSSGGGSSRLTRPDGSAILLAMS
jgi:hypothetical protein